MMLAFGFNTVLFMGNTMKDCLIAVGVAVGALVVLLIVKQLLVTRLKSAAEKTKTRIDDLAVELVRKTNVLFTIAAAAYLGALFLQLTDEVNTVVRAVVVIVALIQGGLWGNQVLAYWITRVLEPKAKDDPGRRTALAPLRFVGKLVIWSVVLLVSLDNLGVEISALLAGLGVGGLAVALAVQNVLGDLFASLSIVLDRPFEIGDFIIVGDLLGTVEHIGLKTTRVRSLSGEQLVFANTDLLGSRIRNYKRMRERRIVFGLGVTYETPLEKLSRIPEMLKQVVESKEQTRFDRAHFKEYGNFALNFEVVYYMLVPDYNAYMDTQQAINLELFRLFQEEGIEFAYPTSTIHLASGATSAVAKT